MAKAKAAKAAETTPAAVRTLVERYEIIEVHRSQLKNAPYNPRVITEKAKRRLRKGIEKLGLLSPLTWNRRSGNLVSGHRRIEALDAINGTKDYMLTVAAVDLDPKQEKEANLLFNNPEAQGDWDLEKLSGMFKDAALDLDATGFDTADLYRMFGDTPMAQNDDEIATDALSEELREARDRYTDTMTGVKKQDNEHFYLVVVFENYDARLDFLAALDLDDNRYQDGREIVTRIEEVSGVSLATLAERNIAAVSTGEADTAEDEDGDEEAAG